MNQDFVDLLRAFIAHDVRTGCAKDLGDIEGLGQ
jgi:hypothetical protein